mmetsp:Transcript_8912/g.25437  ORF Transcript_8912/g.25437 Transcript_8912/m.25437 type:complete len:203 (+) Transcript_8912:1210-1818(+)
MMFSSPSSTPFVMPFLFRDPKIAPRTPVRPNVYTTSVSGIALVDFAVSFKSNVPFAPAKPRRNLRGEEEEQDSQLSSMTVRLNTHDPYPPCELQVVVDADARALHEERTSAISHVKRHGCPVHALAAGVGDLLQIRIPLWPLCDVLEARPPYRVPGRLAPGRSLYHHPLLQRKRYRLIVERTPPFSRLRYSNKASLVSLESP